MREPVELEVLVDGGEVVEPLQHLVEGHRLLVGGEQEGRFDAEGECGDHAEGAEAEPGALEQPGVLGGGAAPDGAVGEDDLQGADLGGERAGVAAGAVGASAGGAGDGLDLDVAHVGEGEALGGEDPVEPVQREAGLDGDGAGRAVDLADGGEGVRADLDAVAGGGDGGEGVAGADGLDGAALFGGAQDLLGQFLRGAGGGGRAGSALWLPAQLVHRVRVAVRPGALRCLLLGGRTGRRGPGRLSPYPWVGREVSQFTGRRLRAVSYTHL